MRDWLFERWDVEPPGATQEARPESPMQGPYKLASIAICCHEPSMPAIFQFQGFPDNQIFCFDVVLVSCCPGALIGSQ